MIDDQPEIPDDATSQEPRSSSPRGPGASDALVKRDDRVIGAMRLPIEGAAEFVDHFNQIYEAIGLSLEPDETLWRK